MSKWAIKTADGADFFRRGRKLARYADTGHRLIDESVISFEDPAEA
ncbi:MAG: hypothetical protein JO142_10940 [Burkholderiales bacterium]|nr:hypothetical protein [Burkholderiales bacterium]